MSKATFRSPGKFQFSTLLGKYMSRYSDKSPYTFPPLVSGEKLARRVPNVTFFHVERMARRERKTGNCLPPRDTQMFGRSDRRATKRPFGFFEEKGRAATPASFSHYYKVCRSCSSAVGSKPFMAFPFTTVTGMPRMPNASTSFWYSLFANKSRTSNSYPLSFR
jgi:hypothetical protein